MPQSERSGIIKKLCVWLRAKSQNKGASLKEIVTHVKVEITEYGATESTIRKYIDDLTRTGFLKLEGYKYKTTEACENWLDRKLSS